MARLEQRPDRYLHAPRLVALGDGSAVLHAIGWEGKHERVLSWRIAANGELGAEQAGPEVQRVVTLTRGDVVQASEDASDEHREARGSERVWVEHEDGVLSVWLARANEQVLVFKARGMAAAPTLARADDGTWVAFHHDVREDSLRSDIAKWISLRFVDAQGRVFEPKAPMTDRDRDREGVEQSFEFPALVVGANGAVSLFGRGSHNYYRQDLDHTGFAPRQALSDGEWGSRGRHIAAALVRDGIVIARREKKGLEVDLLPHAMGQAPELVPARVDVTQARLELSHAKDRDPARTHGLFTLFGDIQQHTAHSDGLGSAEEVYLRARHRYGDDFVALTDHESFLGKRTSPGEWEYLQQVADQFDEPGAFSALYAYEWTGKMYPGPGHKCVYYPGRNLPIVSRDDVPEGKALVSQVRALGGMASPHHIGWTGADEAGHEPVGQPLWEICSCHGCYEHADHPLGARGTLRDQLVDVMLGKGHRFGFTASSDSHGLLWHHGESRKRDPYRTGLTAVQARAVTREAILEALAARRCYATSGAKILLDLTADGAPMGSELAQSDALFRVRAVGTAALARIELVGGTGVLASVPGNGTEAELELRVGAPYVYARVIQEDGEMAWSSPVFFG